jgi:flagellar hook-basal body complex protein FliE
MTGLEAVGSIGGMDAAPVAMRLGGLPIAAPQANAADFGEVLMAGLRNVDQKVASADKLVQQFAIDDSIPVHQVTMALAEARMSVEIAMQVRSRLVESYRELMNMQL